MIHPVTGAATPEETAFLFWVVFRNLTEEARE